jgi:hypothetical protein
MFVSLAMQPSAHYGFLVSRGFLITHNDAPQSVGLVWTSDQLVTETSTDIHAPCWIRTHDRSRRAAVITVLVWQTKYRENLPIMGKFPNLGRCIISHQEVLRSVLKNVNHQADEVISFNHRINGQLLKTPYWLGVCSGALWNFCLSLNCDSWPVKNNLFF